MRPLAQGKGTPHQSTIQQTLMAMVNVSAMAIVFAFVLIVQVASPSSKSLQEAFVSQANQSRGSLSPVSPAQWPHSATSPFLRSNLIDIDSIQISHWDPAMPRARGKPRRGAAWYTVESRRKRKEHFEKAMAMAARRRKSRPRTPPMAYVEEVIPEGGQPNPPEHTLFMVPENWNPRSNFGSDSTRPPASSKLDPSTATAEKPYSPITWKRRFLPNPPRKRRSQSELDIGTGHRKQRRPPARS